MAGTDDIPNGEISTDDPSASFKIKAFNRRHIDFPSADNEIDQASSKWQGPFTFIQAADCQYGMIENFLKRPNPGWQEEIKLSEKAIRAINAMQPRPKFLVVCGDLVDAMPGTPNKPKQIADFKRVFSQLDQSIPLVCVCGNHDVGDEPIERTVSEYIQTFGDDYFSFVCNGVLFLVINSQYYKDRKYVENLAHEQDAWLESMLAKVKQYQHTVLFQHIPWFLERPQEDDDYFNITRETRLKWLKKFKDAGVTKIMCGHYHRNAGGWDDQMEVVVTSAIGAQLGTDESGLRVVRVLDDSIDHRYYSMETIPEFVELPPCAK